MLEGVRLVEEALAAGIEFRGALCTKAAEQAHRVGALLGELGARSIDVDIVSEREFKSVADTDTPQGILAVVELPVWAMTDLGVEHGPVLVLDGVQDPGNVGTLLRTSLSLGGGGAILLAATADLANPKVLRASMGATFRLPTVRATDGELAEWVRAQRVNVWAAAAEGIPLAGLKRPSRLALVVGNEGAGIRPAIRELATEMVAIPLSREVESLNVAVAAGIILYEVVSGR